jgi:biotin operon repressor
MTNTRPPTPFTRGCVRPGADFSPSERTGPNLSPKREQANMKLTNRPSRPTFWNAHNTAELLAMRERGFSNVEIAQKLRITHQAVARQITDLRKSGIEIERRPTGPAKGVPQEPQYHVRGVRDEAETKEQVQARANALMRYWTRQGHQTVVAWVECLGSDRGGKTIYALRSNLVNGLPPRTLHPSIKSAAE